MLVPGNRIPLLYVDDEPDLLSLGKLFLERGDNFLVDTAQSAREALGQLQNHTYECVISDYQMPEIDGIRLLKIIHSRYPDLPVILFTGKGREEVVIAAINAGAAYYIQKGGDASSQFYELGHKIRSAVEKRHIEKALKASEERYRTIVEDQIEFICRFGPDMTLNFVNEAYCRYFNKARQELEGSAFIPKIPGKEQDLVRKHFASLTRENPVATIDHRIILADGQVRWQRWNDRAIFGEDGSLVEYQSVGRDITDLKDAEEALKKKHEELTASYEQLTAIEEELRRNYDELARNQRALIESEARYRRLIETANEGLWVVDRNLNTTFVNQRFADMLGYTREEMAGHNVLEYVIIEDRNIMETQFVARRRGNKSRYECRLTHRDGKIIWCLFSGSPLLDEAGIFQGSFGMVTDITGWKNAENALLQANRKLNLLNTIIQHDTINALTGIFGLVDMAGSIEDKEHYENELARIKELTRVIQRQITFIRDYQNVGSHSPEWQHVGRIIRASFAAPAFRNITLVADTGDREIFADLLLGKVFSSFAENAVRTGEEVTRISFYLVEFPDSLKIIYEDNGNGVPAAIKEQIFERGYYPGAGLGLFLSREILAITGITITENGEPGKGARFEITVPKGKFRTSTDR
jgi:PAS domain S-box-containing protein